MDIFLKLDANGHLFTKFYDKGVYFNFSILNVPHIDSSIPITPTYGVYISQRTLELAVCIQTFHNITTH